MKIRVLSILAVVLIASSACAQTITNVITIVSGINFFVSQLNVGSNTYSEVLSNVPDGTIVYRYSYFSNAFDAGVHFIGGYGWFDNEVDEGGPTNGPVLVPGVGVLIYDPHENYDLTIIGTANIPVLPLSINCSTQFLVGRQTNGLGTFENITGQSAQDGDQIAIYNTSLQGDVTPIQSPAYDIYTSCSGGWSPNLPPIPLGTAVFIQPACPSGCITVQHPNVLMTGTAITTVDLAPPTVNSICVPDYTCVMRPETGSYFLPGTTAVHVVAVDTAGDEGSCDFTVTIAPPPVQPPTGTNQLNIVPGRNLIAYQFKNGGNTLTEIIPNAPDGCVVDKYNNSTGRWLESTYHTNVGAWVPPNIVLNPGDGAFLAVPGAATNLPLFFQGDDYAPVLPLNITNLALVSCQTNSVGNYLNIVGSAPTAGTTVFKWDQTNQVYDVFSFNGTTWSPFEPMNMPGEAWWISPPGGPTSPPLVPIAPVITSEPTNVVVSKAGGATFTVAATGAAPLQYQWLLNANPLVGATNASLTIPAVGPTNCGNYTVFVYNIIGTVTSTPANLSIAGATPLALGNTFASAGALPSTTNGFGIGNNSGGTVEAGEPSPGNIPGGAPIWVSWQAPDTGIATFSTGGSSFDTLLAVYTGTNLSTLLPVASDDDSAGLLCSQVSFNADAGSVYMIQVDGFYGATGAVALSWNLEITASQLPVILSQPHNQTVAAGGTASFTAKFLSGGTSLFYRWLQNGGSGTVSGDTITGTNSGSNELVTITITNVQAAQAGVYQIQASGSVTFSPSTLSFPAQLQISSGDSGSYNSNSLAVSKLQAEADTTVRPNDPYDPPTVSGYTGTLVFSTYGAVCAAYDPPSCGVPCYITQWFLPYMNANTGGLLVVTDSNTPFDGVLTVSTASGNTYTALTCSEGMGNGKEVVSLQINAGTAYYASFSSTNSNPANNGIASVQYNFYTPPVFTTLPMAISTVSNATVNLTASASGTPAISYQWQVNGTNIPGATSPTLPLGGFVAGYQGDYSLIVSNLAGESIFTYAPVYLGNPLHFVNTTNVGAITNSGVFYSQLMGLPNSNYVFQSSPDLSHWTSFYTNNSPNGIQLLLDPLNYPNKFYRAYLPSNAP